jgi:hypothetical protein
MRVAWHLCEIFYWLVSPSESSSTVPAPLITEWARASLDPFSLDDPHVDPSSLEYFWNYVQRLLLRGEISQAVSVLASMSTNSDAITISSLLQRMPILTMGMVMVCISAVLITHASYRRTRFRTIPHPARAVGCRVHK